MRRFPLSLDLPRALGGDGVLSWQPCSWGSELRDALLVTLLAKAKLAMPEVPAMCFLKASLQSIGLRPE